MLACPPTTLLAGATLFLDLDGTLLDLVDRPDQVVADPALRALLGRLNQRLDGRVAVVSGRSLAQLDAILGDAAPGLALSGSHGSEHRWPGVNAHPHRPPTLDEAGAAFRALAARHPGTLVEDKSFGVAFHYRTAPEAHPAAQALATELAEALRLKFQPGKAMVELRVPGGDKGAAVRGLMERPAMRSTTPLFIGDDLTDEPGFVAAVDRGGAGILVGTPRETAARYGLADPAAVRAWLAEAIA